MKKHRFEFRTLLALVLTITIILLPFDTLALTGQAVTSENTATPDEAESTQREKDDDLAQTGANILDGDGTEESPYIIATSDDWDTLSESINSGSTEYSGKYFKMTDDISVSTMLGNRPDTSTDSNDNVFSGVFDGDGHELNVNLDDPIFAAPFAVAHNATIKNLHVTGTVKTGANHSTGLVAASKGKSIYDASYLIIQNVTVSTDVSCNSHIAGIVGHAHSADITMENVVFDGSLSASSVQGGMIGWGGLGNGAMFNASFKDCLFAGTYNTSAAFYPIAYANGQGTTTLVNDFYTTSLGSGGSPVPPTGDGQLKLLSAQVEKDGAVKYFDNINTAADGSNWVEGSTLKLMTDVTTSSTITVPTGEHTLDLNGHGIKMTGSGSVFNIGNGAALDLTDSNQTIPHKFDVPDGAGLATLNETSGNYTVNGGYITGGNANPYGGGVCVAVSGKFNMYGGTIIGNNAVSHGGGVSVSGNNQAASSVDNFKMYGGAVSYNTANWGGGIGIYGKTYLYEKSIISNNTANAGGGGIELENNGRLYMSGGTVTENAVLAQNGGMWKGGGIHMPNGSECHIQGNVLIKDNYQETYGSKQNNLFIRKEVSGKVILDGELTSTAPIGVGTNGNAPFTVTAGYGAFHAATDPSKYFTSDDSNYAVILNSNGEAEIAPPPVASIISGDVTTGYSSISDAVSAWTAGSTLKLLADVTTNSTVTVPSGEHTLDLNGYGILMTGNDRVVTINQGASLELNDSDPDTIHYITLTDYRGTAVSDSGEASVSDGNGVIKVTGGYLTGGYRNNSGSHDRCGAGVYNWGTFVMNGGSIVGNTLYNNSGGAIRNSGYFTMNGGTIAFNYASGNGGGVTTYVPGGSQGKMTMNGGEISDNYCGSYGGGIQIAGPIEMTGGSVVRNTAGAGGSGVFYDGKNDRFKLSGNPVIKDNSNNDDLYLGANATFMINGSLTEEADIHVLMNTPAEFTVGWKNIMGNADPSKYFSSDDSNYTVILNNNGEAEIGVPPVACVISGDTTTNYGSLSEAVNAWAEGSTLKLLADVTTSSTITVPAGEHTLDLNGYGIKVGTTGYSVINVGSGVTLDLTDSDQTKTHKFDVPDGAGLAKLNETSGTYTVNGGYITGGNSNQGGGVYVKGGTLILTGGTIIGNQAQREGGGVIIESGSCTMNGGAIIYNKSQTHWGGGINVGGPFNMSGGVVSHNYAGEGAGGVHCHSLVMTGGSITDNYAAGSYAGGVNVNNNATLSGNITITDNTNNTGKSNLYCKSVIIADTLSDTSSIGIKTQSGTGIFTTGWKDKMGGADPSKCFSSDNDDYIITLNDSGEAEINLPPVASIISGETTTNYSSISDAVSAWTADSTLKLLADVTTNSTITVPSGEHTLDLNGYALKAASAGYSVITVGSGAELTIDDTSDTVGKITGGSVGQNYGGGVTVDGGTLTLKGGAISGNANTHGGIGNCGGGVHVRNGGKFYMESGEISGNTSYVGGGVCSDNSATTVSITGGVIKNNKTDRFGSAIWAGRSSSAVFRIGGDVQIIDNISTWTADKDGEASVNFVGELLLSGDPTVHGDWKTSGTSAPNSHINLDNDGSGVQRLTLEGALTNDTGAPSITMSPIYRWNDLRNGQTFVFTKNWNQYMGTAHPADYFNVDSSLSGISIIRKDGEAAFTGSGDLGDLYITYDANGGVGEMAPQLATVTNVTLNANTFTRKGYSFAGWNTKKDGSGTAYDDKANITLSGDLTLYAQWKEYVASVISGETTTDYGTLSDAVNAWTAGSTLKLLSDVTTDSTITVPTGTHTLDLNGYTITRTGATGSDNSGLAMTVNNGVDLTVTGPGKITGGKGFHGGGIHVEGNSSLVLDNCEISGNTGHYGGGLYLKNGTITMKNGTVVKENSASEGFGGSGIYAEGGGTLIMDGCTFTQNAIKNNNQYAVFLCGNANIKVSGAPVINDNTYNGAHHDLYMFQAGDQHSTVLIAGALTDGTKITVGQTSGAGVITGGWKDKMGEADPSKYFTSDDSNYSVAAADGEAWLCEELTGVIAEGFEGDYDGEAHGITVSAPDGAAVKYGTTEGSYTLTDNPTYTDAGTYTVYYEVSKTGCIPVYGSEQVEITPIDVTVTITGHTLTVDYDGRAHSADGYDATASSTLYNVTKNITYSGRAEAVRTNVGTTQMGLTAEKFSNTNDNFANVTFYVTDGSVTIDPVDAVLTPAPHAKDQLVYNGSNQTLVEPGTVTGGTLCYALGSDERIAPSDSQYDQDVPVAKDVGNYYIWYKVIADSNHNDLAPACVKVTLAEEGWTTVSGRVYDEDNNPVSNATVSLTIGGKTVDQIVSGSDGGYYFTAPPGLYNIVVKYDGATVTDMIDINESTTYDVSIFDANTDSFLNIVGTDNNIVVGGLNKEAEAVRAREGVSSDKNVTVSMTVTPIAGGETYAAAAIEEYASDRNVLYYDFEVEETVDMITTYLDRTQTVLEIAIPCSFVNKQELTVYTSDGSFVQTLTPSDSKAAGTYRVDTSAGLVYIYTDEITTYALGYKPYYSVTSDVSLGSYTGVVSVTLTKDGETIYELNDVSMDNISFRGVPKGTYSMTITWTDGAENTLTTPFEIQ